MKLWRLALLAFLAMMATDMLSTVMVIFEARYDAPMAGAFDVLGWLAWLASSGLAVEAIVKEGWRSRRARIIIAAVSVANFAGTFAGVAIGAAIAHHRGVL